jgi:NTP pyrophosphatase (non-canonical NTP hydrolase)
MKESFEELYGVARKNRINSPWAKNMTVKSMTEELKEEVEEVLKAVELGDIKNLHEELGDTLWTLLNVIVVAEEKHGFENKKIIDNAVEKIKRRKPWIFVAHNYTIEEELKMWEKAKEEEKND